MLSEKDKMEMCSSYVDDLTSMIKLGLDYGVSRQAVFKVLRDAGVDTSKRKLVLKCACCGGKILRVKSRARKSRSHFCDSICYFAWLEIGNGKGEYKPSRWGQKVARVKIEKDGFVFKEGMIPHHEDRNCLNNELWNLKVFASQGDHVRYHRGFKVEPVWDGSKI